MPVDDDQLNLAQICRRSRVLGPGQRYGIWVQGCPFDCPGCLAQEWRAIRQNRQVLISHLIADVMTVPDLEGITISGGEPMLQAKACATLIEGLRRHRPGLTLIVFSGFRLKDLRANGRVDQLALLEAVDVLIDGGYEEELNDNHGLRGSANQCVHFLSSAYNSLGKAYFESQPRRVELHLGSKSLFMVGIPPRGVDPAIREILPS